MFDTLTNFVVVAYCSRLAATAYCYYGSCCFSALLLLAGSCCCSWFATRWLAAGVAAAAGVRLCSVVVVAVGGLTAA